METNETTAVNMQIDDENNKNVYNYNCVRCNISYDELNLLKEHYFDKHINALSSKSLTSATATTSGTTRNSRKKFNLEKITTNLQKRQSKRTKLSTSNLDTDDEDKNNEDYYIENSGSSFSGSSTSFKTNSSITIKRRRKDVAETSKPVESNVATEATSSKLISPKKSTAALVNSVVTSSIDIDKKLEDLSEEEMKTFNLENIDEKKFIDLVGDGVYNKKRELLAGRIVWVLWRNIMWPAMIVKVNKAKRTSGASSLKIHIRYYEKENKLGNVFKMDPSKVELFYKCKDHVHYKVLGAINQGQRKEFYIAYTNALKDYTDFIEKNKKENEDDKKNLDKIQPKPESDQQQTSTQSSNNNSKQDKKYLVLGKYYTLDEVKNYANKPYTQEQINQNAKREEESAKLMEYIMSDECKNFLIAIMTDKETKCQRHLEYLHADTRSRRKMKFTYIGPLTQDDSIKLGKYLGNLCKTTYKDKPHHLNTYEYDVLYPEAVIWGIRKQLGYTYKRAEYKWRQGFKSTAEELMKCKCNEILNKITPTTTTTASTTKTNKDNEENDANYCESDYNDDDTSFFTYCSNTNNDTQKDIDVDKTFNETVSMLNNNDDDENNENKNDQINDKENLNENNKTKSNDEDSNSNSNTNHISDSNNL